MAAKKQAPVAKRKRVRKVKSADQQPNTTKLVQELIQRCTELRDSGQVAKARKLLAQVEKLQKALQAMEAALQRPNVASNAPK